MDSPWNPTAISTALSRETWFKGLVVTAVSGLYLHGALDFTICLDCGLPFEPGEWSADLSGIGDDCTNWVTF